jgi:3',5'-cyclic AMP phosphodiesterase CpdA
MSPIRLIVVSDSHLSLRTPEAEENWSAVVEHVAHVVPDLVIHLGDLSLDGVRDSDDLRFSRSQLDRLPVPWLAIPGNHDIGDNPSPAVPDDLIVDAERCERWIDLVGADRWSVELPGWKLVAINAQLIDSGLPQEAEQWAWLQDEIGRNAGRLSVALVTHKPLEAGEEELSSSPHYRFVPASGRRRIAELAGDGGIDLVLSGHVHQYRRLEMRCTTHVWAPTTWAVLPDVDQPIIGAKRCGVLLLALDEGGFDEALVEPDGVRQQTLGEDLTDPYSV